LIALALLALGEQAPSAFPVHVRLEAHGATLQVSVDGSTHEVSSALGGGWSGVQLEQPGPVDREYQIDGSDTTSTSDRDGLFISGLVVGSPLYRFDSWLRDEGTYSRWENFSLVDLDTGAALAPGPAPLPTDFRLDADLGRPEAAARLWLIGANPGESEGLELARDTRNARWIIQRSNGPQSLPRWFFPEQPMPFFAELLWLLGRSVVAAYALAVAALVGGATIRCVSRKFKKTPEQSEAIGTASPLLAGGREGSPRFIGLGWTARAVGGLLLAGWLFASGYVTVHAYQQLPHILDAVSYTFQAGLFASGQLALSLPPVTNAFLGPFEVVWNGRIFSQYPPGAPAIYALGKLANVEWLVGPLACVVLVGATAWAARALYGTPTGVTVLVLGVISPFVLFQSGSYLSHPIAGGLMAAALAAFVAAEQEQPEDGMRCYAMTGALLGAGFMAREVAGVLFAVPLGLRLLAQKRWTALAHVVAFGLPFLLAYLLYNQRQTGNPLLLPRALFDASDHFGFGNGVGFHTRHTLAAGLANTDELLTLLQFDLFGWPPLFAFGLLGLPFLLGAAGLGRAGVWDWMALGGFGAFVIAYIGYFYHGIALGPRYYFEAIPWLLLLGGRGVQTIAQLCRSRAIPAVIVGALTLNTVLFYTPAELARRTDLSGLPSGVKLLVGFVQSSPTGPKLTGVPDHSLVVTNEWWVYNASLAALNCPRIPDCGVVFALAMTPADVDRLRAQFPDRALLQAVNDRGVLTVEPY
jgi:hypothetical protein